MTGAKIVLKNETEDDYNFVSLYMPYKNIGVCKPPNHRPEKLREHQAG